MDRRKRPYADATQVDIDEKADTKLGGDKEVAVPRSASRRNDGFDVQSGNWKVKELILFHF